MLLLSCTMKELTYWSVQTQVMGIIEESSAQYCVMCLQNVFK